jgi:cytochrome c oxidase subunit 3
MNNDDSSAPHRPSRLPVSNGRFAMWLFLSALVMFFTALVGSYVVLRLGEAKESWPTLERVGLDGWALGVNAVALCLASLSMVWTVTNARTNRRRSTKTGLLAVIVFAGLFLGATAVDYASKFSRGISPGFYRSLMHQRADVDYLAAVKSVIQSRLREALNKQNSGSFFGNPRHRFSDSDENAAKEWQLIQNGLVQWTERTVGRSDDPLMRQLSIEALAFLIDPQSFGEIESAKITQFLSDEDLDTRFKLVQLKQQLAKAQQRLRIQQSKISSHTSRLEGTSGQSANEDSKPGHRAGELTRSITAMTQQRDWLQYRIQATEKFGSGGAGINQTHELRLPFLISGGNTWSNAYFLLTGLHGIHVGVAMLLCGGLLLIRLEDRRVGLVENVGLFWHFVVAVWFFLIALIYLI